MPALVKAGLSALSKVTGVSPFVIALGVYFAATLVILGAFGATYQAGRARAAAACETASLKMQLAARELEARLANERAARAQDTISGLEALDADNRARIAALVAELATRPLQSTKPGAKPDADALLDDRCNYTPAGAARDRRLRR